MEMIAVKSSNIESYAVDGSTLALRFINGDSYHYLLVPESVIQGFINSSSKGKYFHSSIRGRFHAVRQ